MPQSRGNVATTNCLELDDEHNMKARCHGPKDVCPAPCLCHGRKHPYITIISDMYSHTCHAINRAHRVNSLRARTHAMTIKGEGTHTRSQLGRCRGCFHGWVAMSAGGGSACMQALWDVRGRGSSTGALEGLGTLGKRRFWQEQDFHLQHVRLANGRRPDEQARHQHQCGDKQ